MTVRFSETGLSAGYSYVAPLLTSTVLHGVGVFNDERQSPLTYLLVSPAKCPLPEFMVTTRYRNINLFLFPVFHIKLTVRTTNSWPMTSGHETLVLGGLNSHQSLLLLPPGSAQERDPLDFTAQLRLSPFALLPDHPYGQVRGSSVSVSGLVPSIFSAHFLAS